MTKRHLRQALYFAEAVICGISAVAPSPIMAGLALAAINVALALCD